MMAKRLLVAAFFISLPLAVVMAHGQSSPQPARSTPSASGLDLQYLDRSADPCDDFYAFACGGWAKSQPIPADYPEWDRIDEMQRRNELAVRRILEHAADTASADADVRRLGDYYASCLDERAIDAKGPAPLERALAKITRVTRSDLAALVGELHGMGVNVFFRFTARPDANDATMVRGFIDQGGLGLPDRDYYFKADATSAGLRKQYTEHVARMLALLTSTTANAIPSGDAVVKIETVLAHSAMTAVARRDPEAVYHKLTPAELQRLTPSFNWSAYFQATGAPAMDAVVVTEPDFLKGVNTVVATSGIEDLRAYLRWWLTHAFASILPGTFVDEDFRFYGTALTGAKELQPRWRRCVQYTDRDLSEMLGKAYVNEAFSGTAKDDTLGMVRQLESSLERDIQQLSWMSDTTKQQAMVKLQTMTNKIGYPDRWRDYGALSIVRGDAAGNVQRSWAFEFHRQMGQISQPTDKNLWPLTPLTVNAYYRAVQNDITFPAGILQPPVYIRGADAAVNYGATGSAVGHELTHGFDARGRKFDAHGNLRDWWTAEDAKRFEDRAACYVDEYNSFTVIDDVKVNGQLTLAENGADDGGLRIALMACEAFSASSEAHRNLDGFSPEQRFFLGYALTWCESVRPEQARLWAQINPHSPGKYRVNGVVSNMPEFAKAFSCRPNAPMVRRNACRIW